MDTAEFYTYTKDLRESTINIVGKDGISQKTYSYTDYGETTEQALPFCPEEPKAIR